MVSPSYTFLHANLSRPAITSERYLHQGGGRPPNRGFNMSRCLSLPTFVLIELHQQHNLFSSYPITSYGAAAAIGVICLQMCFQGQQNPPSTDRSSCRSYGSPRHHPRSSCGGTPPTVCHHASCSRRDPNKVLSPHIPQPPDAIY